MKREGRFSYSEVMICTSRQAEPRALRTNVSQVVTRADDMRGSYLSVQVMHVSQNSPQASEVGGGVAPQELSRPAQVARPELCDSSHSQRVSHCLDSPNVRVRSELMPRQEPWQGIKVWLHYSRSHLRNSHIAIQTRCKSRIRRIVLQHDHGRATKRRY